MTDFSKLKRERRVMTDDVRRALLDAGQLKAYQSRPAYQQNDYLAWIARAVRAETREKRMRQMIDELRAGNVYMKMRWNNENKMFKN